MIKSFNEFMNERKKNGFNDGTRVLLKSKSELSTAQLESYGYEDRKDFYGNDVLIIDNIDWESGLIDEDNIMYKVKFEDTTKKVPDYTDISEVYSIPGMFLKLVK
jgi:hypothetical protein